MILVIARARDASAESVVSRWRERGAALLTARDLSRTGWRHRVESPLDGTAVISDRLVPVRDITGIVTTIPSVTASDLPHIVAEDRAYVAGEIQAFLLAWLEALPCPMLNRPTPRSLAGCGWRPEEWALAATAAGIPTVAVHKPEAATGQSELGADRSELGTVVTYVGGRALDAPSEQFAGWVRRLAASAGTNSLVARFRGDSDPHLQSADVVPDLARPDVADAALQFLAEAGT